MLLPELGVDADDDVADFGHDGAQQLHVPLFERFAHDGVVRVGKNMGGDVERSIEVETLRHQQAD